jgi:hypothetical protein
MSGYEIFGYNPNRDSGIVEARSYVEVSKEVLGTLSGMIELDRDPTKRYFAQIVYNVGPGSSIIDNLTPDEILEIRKLLSYKDKLLSLKTVILQFVPTDSDNSNETPDPINDSPIEIASPVNPTKNLKINIYARDLAGNSLGGLEGINVNDLENIQIPGYVCGVETYEFINAEGDVSENTARFLPRVGTTKTADNENLQDSIDSMRTTFLDLSKEIAFIVTKFNDAAHRIIKISYLDGPIVENPGSFTNKTVNP